MFKWISLSEHWKVVISDCSLPFFFRWQLPRQCRALAPGSMVDSVGIYGVRAPSNASLAANLSLYCAPATLLLFTLVIFLLFAHSFADAKHKKPPALRGRERTSLRNEWNTMNARKEKRKKHETWMKYGTMRAPQQCAPEQKWKMIRRVFLSRLNADCWVCENTYACSFGPFRCYLPSHSTCCHRRPYSINRKCE